MLAATSVASTADDVQPWVWRCVALVPPPPIHAHFCSETNFCSETSCNLSEQIIDWRRNADSLLADLFHNNRPTLYKNTSTTFQQKKKAATGSKGKFCKENHNLDKASHQFRCLCKRHICLFDNKKWREIKTRARGVVVGRRNQTLHPIISPLDVDIYPVFCICGGPISCLNSNGKSAGIPVTHLDGISAEM